MSDPPSEDGRRSRSDAAARLAALFADVAETPAPASTDPDLVDPAERDRPRARADVATWRTERRRTVPEDDDGRPTPAELLAELTPAGAAPAPVAPSRGRDAPRPTPARPGPFADEDDAPGTVAPPADATVVAPRPAEPPGPFDEDTEKEDAENEDGDGAATPAAATVPIVAEPPSPVAKAPAVPAPKAKAPAPTPTPAVKELPAARETSTPEPIADAPAPPPPVTGLRSVVPGSGRLTVRAAAFGSVLVLLIAAIPVLGWIGKERILESRGGKVVDTVDDPTKPGYTALVAPTRTALVVQRDGEGLIVAATLLSLGAGKEGGTVLQVPLDTASRSPRYLIEKIEDAFIWADDETFIFEVQDRLGVAVPDDNVIDLDDESLASLVDPVAPLEIDNPDDAASPEGQQFLAGSLSLAAADVGPFLRATNPGETELAHLARNEAFWTAWLAAVGEAAGGESIGAATTGIGPFLRVLSAGDPMVETLDVSLPADSIEEDPALLPTEAFEEQVNAAVPYPESPAPGRRWTMKLLNGVEAADLPKELMHDLIVIGGSLATVGNGDEFDQDETTVEYSGANGADAAAAIELVLGDGVTTEQMSQARDDAEDEEIVITIGRATLDRYEQGGDEGG